MPLGSIGEIALAVQTGKGVPVAASTQRFAITAGMPDVVKPPNVEPFVGTKRSPLDAWVPAAYGAGPTSAVARPKMIGALLYAALGTKAVAGAADPWSHTFTLGTVLPWLTVWRHFGAILSERYVDTRISKLTIQSRIGSVVDVSFEILSGSPRYRTTQETTAALETTQHLEHVHGSGALLIEGVAVRPISGWTLTIDTGVVIEQTLAGPVPRMSGLAQIGLVIEYRPADAALWKRVVYGSATPAEDAVPSTAPLELAGTPAGIQFTLTAALAPERSLRISIPRVIVDPMEMVPNTRGGPVRNTLNLRAYDPGGATSPITALLKNGLSAY